MLVTAPNLHDRRLTRAAIVCAALGLGDARASESFGDYMFYVGDPHSHTGVSGDGSASDMGSGCFSCGAIADVFEYATIQGLDWVAFSDHSNDAGGTRNAGPSDFSDFWATQLAHDDDATGLVIIPAAEVWFDIGGSPIGHRNLMMFGDDAALASFSVFDATPNGDITSEIGTCSAMEAWMDTLTATWGNALIIPHHPYGLAPAPMDWSCHSATYEPAVEVYSHWGNSLGWGRVYDRVTLPQTGHSVHDGMDPTGYGLHMGFMGGTDSHDTRPGETCTTDTGSRYGGGLTMVVTDPSEVFSREAIYNAIVAHSTYATTGPIVPMTVTFFVDGVEIGHLGQDLDIDAGASLVVQVAVPEDDATNTIEVVLVTPDTEIPADYIGDGVWEATVDSAEMPAWLYAAVNLDGIPYRSRTTCNDGGDTTEWLWSSPSWITTWDEDGDADGVTLGDGDCADDDASVRPGAAEIWYDGVDQDCDGQDDFDRDGDGYRAIEWGGSDCADGDPSVRRPPMGHRVPPDCDP